MQIQFDPKKLDASEATFVAGVGLAAIAKAAHADGATIDEFKSMMAEMADAIWSDLQNATEED